VFSPYYAWARRRGGADPSNHCAINVALYGANGHRWSMTERGRGSITREPDLFRVGPSSMAWRDGALVIDINEVTVPIPSRLRGEVRLVPSALSPHVEVLDALGQHHWRPVAPRARIEVEFEAPGLRWIGDGYHDMNWGDVALEDSFIDWTWSRAVLKEGAGVIYDTLRRDGTRKSFALRFDEQGRATSHPVPPAHALPRCFWRMGREARSEDSAAVVSTLEDAPFYARSLIRARMFGEQVTAFHESLSLDRFRSPVVQAMLPVRMPRRA
jgi:carotenoid 1,2-hydratase